MTAVDSVSPSPWFERVTFTLEPLQGSDRLSVARFGARQCVVATAMFAGTAEGIFVREGAVVDVTAPDFVFLAAHANRDMSTGNAGLRVRPMKIRGVRSDGLLVPLSEDARELLDGGMDPTDFEAAVGIEPFERIRAVALRGDAVDEPRSFPRFSPPAERGKGSSPEGLDDEDEVVVVEAIRGVQLRVALTYQRTVETSPRYVVGSRDSARHPGGANLFSVMARQCFPEEALRAWADARCAPFFAHVLLVAQVYGAHLFDLDYGCAPGEHRAALQAVVLDGAEQSREIVEEAAAHFGVGVEPVLGRGPMGSWALALAEGPSVVAGATHGRAGAVVVGLAPDDTGRLPRELVPAAGHARDSEEDCR